MKVLKIIGIVLVTLVAVLFITVQLLPSEVHIQRSINVNAPAAMIYQDLIIFKNFGEWSPFPALDPEMTTSYSGPTYGTGGSMSWESNVLGNGSMTLVDANYQQGITYEMTFEGNASRPLAEIQLFENENGTQVTWTYDDKDLHGLSRIMGVMMDPMMGPTYEQGLQNLKLRMESMPKMDFEAEVAITSSYNFLSLKDTIKAPMEMITPKLAQAYGQLMNFMGNNNLEIVGAPISFYLTEDDENFEFVPGLPTQIEDVEDDRFEVRQTPDGYAIRMSYFGNYEDMVPAYEQLYAYIDWLKVEPTGGPWEEYVTDPGDEPDPSNWLTYIYVPIN